MLMTPRYAALTLTIALLPQAPAAVTITVSEIGGGVQFEASGSFNLDGFRPNGGPGRIGGFRQDNEFFFDNFVLDEFDGSSIGSLVISSAGGVGDVYEATLASRTGSLFENSGIGDFVFNETTSADRFSLVGYDYEQDFGFDSFGAVIYVPEEYSSNRPINFSTFASDVTIEDLGFSALGSGTITFQGESGATDSFILNVVPEPSAAILLLGGLTSLGLQRRRAVS